MDRSEATTDLHEPVSAFETAAQVRPVSADEERRRDRKARFRASLAWALDEYASVLAKLAR